MARRFNGSSDYLENASALLTTTPLTIAAWFNLNSLGSGRAICGIYAGGSPNNRFALKIRDTNAVAAWTTSALALSTATVGATGVWHHACGVWASSTSRAAFLDGANKGTNATSASVTSPTRTDIGRDGTSTPFDFFDGLIANVVMWNIALTDAEVALHAIGVPERFIHPEAIVGCWPLWGLHSPEIDLCGAPNPMTVNGTTVALHYPEAFYRRGTSGNRRRFECPLRSLVRLKSVT